MATYIKTLKEDNGDITYPQTKAGAVLLTGGGDLESELAKYVTAEDIASTSALTPPVTTSMIADSAVTSAKIANGTVAPVDMNFSKFFFYKVCPAANPMTISTAWTNTAITGWSFTITTEADAIYKVEVASGYVVYNGPSMAELDFKISTTGMSELVPVPSTMTGTYGGGATIGRIATGIYRATSTSATITANLNSGATGSNFRVDAGYILVMRIA